MNQKPNNSGKKFIFAYLVIILSIIVSYPFVSMIFVNLHGKPGLDSVRLWYKAKNNISKSLAGEPILYVVGGSSAFWGVEAEMIESEIHFRVVNYGIHAGISLDYQLIQLQKHLKRGDKVLLAFESSLLGTERSRMNDFFRSYIFTYDPWYLFHLGLFRLFRETYAFSLSEFKQSLINWFNYKDNKFNEPEFRNIGQLEFGRRGDRKVDSHAVRPLQPSNFFGIGKHAGIILTRFLEDLRAINIEVFFTWQTTIRRENGLKPQEVEACRQTKDFFLKHGAIVLGEPTDYLFPIYFFRDTALHLSQAGKRVRTEKLLTHLRNHFNGSDTSKKQRKRLLLAQEDYQFLKFSNYTDSSFISSVFCSEGQFESESILGIDDVKSLVANNTPVFFSDVKLLDQLVKEKLSITVVSEVKRSLQTDMISYQNHIFFITYKLPELADQKVHFKEINRHLLGNKDYGVLIFGTGKYRSISKRSDGIDHAEISINKNTMLQGFKIPFNVHLAISKKSRIFTFDKCEVFPNQREDSGIRLVIYDPASEIVVDHFYYNDLSEHVSGRLYKIDNASTQYQYENIPFHELTFAGDNPPDRSLGNGILTIDFTGRNSFVGWRLDPKRVKHGCLVMEVRKIGNGEVKAGFQPEKKYGVVKRPRIMLITKTGNWERIVMEFEVIPTYNTKQGRGYLGLLANKGSTRIDIRNVELVRLE